MELKEKPPINVVGDVSGKIAIVVDDIIDNVESFVSVAAVLKDRGAYKVYVMATHGLLSADAPRLIEDSAIDEVNLNPNPNCNPNPNPRLNPKSNYCVCPDPNPNPTLALNLTSFVVVM